MSLFLLIRDARCANVKFQPSYIHISHRVKNDNAYDNKIKLYYYSNAPVIHLLLIILSLLRHSFNVYVSLLQHCSLDPFTPTWH